MTTTQILLIAVAAIGVLAALSIVSIAARRGPERAPSDGPEPEPAQDEPQSIDLPAEPTELEGVPIGPPPIDPLLDREEVDAETMGVTRRQFFNRGILGIFGLFLAQFGVASLAFMWPRLKSGGFGSKVNAGNLDDLKLASKTPDGRVQPVFISAAQAYVVPFEGNPAGSSFEGLPVIVDGMMALWQRCVHLGCRVPQCDASQGFECPCHGSKYNYHGEYEGGPAPRNLDRFIVSLNDAGELIIDTGAVIRTSRASVKTIEYPQGPSCI